MEGELWPNDSAYINNVVNQLNELKIPIKVCLTSDTSVAKLRVYFGSFKYLEKKLGLKDYPTFRGFGRLSFDSSHIRSACVAISNDSGAYSRIETNADTATIREGIIFQEIIQSLGAIGDSWLHYESLFFEGINRSVALSEIDKNLIMLLYEPTVPPNYAREQFERDFADILYNVDSKRKLLKYVKDGQVPISYLEAIKTYCITDSALIKYPRRIFIKLLGNYDKIDSVFCVRLITEFNKVSNEFQMIISGNDIYSNPCINIHFIPSQYDTTSVTGKMSVMHTQQMFRRRIVGDIKIWYPKSQSVQKRLYKNKSIVKSIYKILGFKHIEEEVAVIDSTNNITIIPKYREMLALFYNPIIPTGFTKKEMEEVLKELKQ
jgi:hypothetical protein